MTQQGGVENLAWGANAKRLVRKLTEQGVEFQDATSLFIHRDQRQALLNKVAGTDAPTWVIGAGGARQGGRLVQWNGKPARVKFQEREYRGIQSHIPLTWILKFDPAKWEISPSENEQNLEITVNQLPPHW